MQLLVTVVAVVYWSYAGWCFQQRQNDGRES